MKHLKNFESTELEDMLGKLSHLTTLMRQESDRQNRRRVTDTKTFRSLSEEYKDYFYDFIDDGWDVNLYETQFYTNIEIIKKFVSNYNSEDVFDKISPLLSSIKNEFTQDGFNTHYQILFNGVSQCENNPVTHKNDIYVYKGDWDDELSKYRTKGELLVAIRFYFI